MKNFGAVKWHEHIIKNLKSALRNGKTSHAYIISGPDGVGKRTVADAFARALQCEEYDGDSCGKCISCRSFDSGNCEDYLHLLLTDEDDIPEAMGRLRTLYPNLLKLSYDNSRTRSNQDVAAAEDVQHKSPLALFAELYEAQNNQPMSPAQHSYMQAMIEAIWEART